ncbi:cytochrome P450 [Hirschia litorea]|uniref:Cytochrome P450 n=1 Tax=Hirschia litorea TaxID=1199156 RepID=A0ABW2IK44_9PROT
MPDSSSIIGPEIGAARGNEDIMSAVERGRFNTRGVVAGPDQVDMNKVNLLHPELWRSQKCFEYFQWLRDNSPIHYTEDSPEGPFWSITRFDDIVAVDKDHERFSSDSKYGGITVVDLNEGFKLPMFIAMDRPEHTKYRKAVQPVLDSESLKNFEHLIRKRTIETLDSLPIHEPFDWVDKVSVELTTMMLATLFDFPQEERRKLSRWSDVATGKYNKEICPGGEAQWQAELTECLMKFMTLWQERGNRDEPGHDLLSALAHNAATKNMTPQELLGNLILLIVGGNDSTRNTMTGSVYAWNKYPKEFEKVKADRSLVPNMAAEAIRWQTSLAYMRRTAVEDVEMHGKTIRKGDKVLMWYVSGNRDERAIERPNDFWIGRPNVRRHLSFGFGIHRCVGNRLAEMQMRILWEEILNRFNFIEVLEEPERMPNSFVRGYKSLNVILHPL